MNIFARETRCVGYLYSSSSTASSNLLEPGVRLHTPVLGHISSNEDERWYGAHLVIVLNFQRNTLLLLCTRCMTLIIRTRLRMSAVCAVCLGVHITWYYLYGYREATVPMHS